MRWRPGSDPGSGRPGWPPSTSPTDRTGGPMREVTATDYHTAGEPFRIVTSGVPEIPGATVAERRARAPQDAAADQGRPPPGHAPPGAPAESRRLPRPPGGPGAAPPAPLQ